MVLESFQTFVLDEQSLLVDLKLGSELKLLHLFVDLEVAVLSPHAAVEELIEVNEAVVALDTHFEELFLKLAVIVEFLGEPE